MKLRPLQISAALLILTALLPSAAYARGDAKYNIDSFLQQLPAYMAKFKTANGAGEFSYLPGGRKPDLYGTTDMVYLLYSLDMLDTLSDKDKQNWAALIQSFQNEKTGWFGGNVTMHGKEHALAYAVGALKLLGAKPAHPFSFRNKYETAENIERMFETTPWDAIWSGSHIASGIASAFINTGIADVNWLSSYFSWLNREADPATGFWMRKNNGSRKNTATNNELGGAFHFYFIYTFTGQPPPPLPRKNHRLHPPPTATQRPLRREHSLLHRPRRRLRPDPRLQTNPRLPPQRRRGFARKNTRGNNRKNQQPGVPE